MRSSGMIFELDITVYKIISPQEFEKIINPILSRLKTTLETTPASIQ
jgi:hypothetical protein